MLMDTAPHGSATPPKPGRRPFPTSFSLVHVAGIDIRVHVSFFVLVALFALAFSGAGAPGPFAGLAWLVVIFACVVVHELSHCLVARRRGGTVHEIVLLPIGGVSRLEHLPETAADEFAIAIAGPLASFGLAGVSALLVAASRQALLPIDLVNGSFLARFVWFNAIVGAFNLLPAFPLDGGRVLRSLLERRYDLERATHIAASVGRAFALFLVAVGLLFDLWLVIIGLFVYVGATAEERATTIHIRLRGRRVVDVMLRDPIVLDASTMASDVAALRQATPQRVFPVVDGSSYLGLLRITPAAPGQTETSAADLTDRSTPPVAPTSNLEEDALPLLVRSPARAVAVADGTRIVGLVCIEDVEHLLAEAVAHRP
jgi:Zn-dependent protease